MYDVRTEMVAINMRNIIKENNILSALIDARLDVAPDGRLWAAHNSYRKYLAEIVLAAAEELVFE